MTIRYVGPGGSDGNSGLTWALRKLTLNGVEDTPVVAGDIVYVGPGTYRETLTYDVSGSAGNPISYIGDIGGANTDGIGGLIRVTGLDSDSSGFATRTNCIDSFAKNYRNISGFYLDYPKGGGTDWTAIITNRGGNNWIIENCVLNGARHDDVSSIGDLIMNYWSGGAVNNIIIRNCIFVFANSQGISFRDAATTERNFSGSLVENCFYLGYDPGVLYTYYARNIIFQNCSIIATLGGGAAHAGGGISVADSIGIYDCILMNCASDSSMSGAATWIDDDYNAWCNVNTHNLTGANNYNSMLYRAMPVLLAGFMYPQENWVAEILGQTAITHQGNNSAPSTDLFGIDRPTGSSKQTPGAIQYTGVQRDTATKKSGASSIKLKDAGRYIFPIIANPGKKHTVSVYVNREANYAGTNPQLVIKRFGQDDIVVTDGGSSGSWNRLLASFWAGANEDYAQIEYVSDNTATSGSFAIYFDDYKLKVQ